MGNSATDHRSAFHQIAPGRTDPRARKGSADDWHVTAVIFAIIGGFAALWAFDLSLLSGGLAAMISAIAGLAFASR